MLALEDAWVAVAVGHGQSEPVSIRIAETELRTGLGVESLRGSAAVEEGRLTDGMSLPAGAVVVGVGVAPRGELAEAAELDLDNGAVVDEHLATSAPGIYAAGDVANAFHPLFGTRDRLGH